jgi:hypothetical protein
MLCIVSTFPKTIGNDGTGLQCIIVYYGSRYLGATAGCHCREPLGERERTLPYYSHEEKLYKLLI